MKPRAMHWHRCHAFGHLKVGDPRADVSFLEFPLAPMSSKKTNPYANSHFQDPPPTSGRSLAQKTTLGRPDGSHWLQLDSTVLREKFSA